MRTVRPHAWIALCLLAAFLAGCIAADDEQQEPGDEETTQDEERGVPENIEALILHAGLELTNVNEITLRGDHAYLSGNSGSFIVDISDPRNPEVVAEMQCTGIHVRTVDLGDQLLMTLSSQAHDNCDGAAQRGGLRIIDVTDPMYPVVGPQLELDFGSHTHTQYNDTGLIFNSAYNHYTRFQSHENVHQHMRSEIIDVTDWQNPKVVKEFEFPAESTSLGCHDIWPEPERDRAVCAAIDETQIWDMSDPLEPRIVSIIRNPLISIHHSSTTTTDGKTLIIGDEWTGALGPGCLDGGIAPVGALWFYDISDPTDPQVQGYFAPPHFGPAMPCTAHNFNVIGDSTMLVAAFFRAGTVLVDFSDPTDPQEQDHYLPEDANTWASYYHNGFVYTGDAGRGMDVLKFVPKLDEDCDEIVVDTACLLPNP